MKDTMQIEKELNQKADPSKNEQKVAEERKKQGNDTVAVCCGVPEGQRFRLKDGTVGELKGIPISHLVSAEKGNARLLSGKHGVTTIKASQWEEIKAGWGNTTLFKNNVIFAKKDLDSALDAGSELVNERMGFEQADPKKGSTQGVSEED